LGSKEKTRQNEAYKKTIRKQKANYVGIEASALKILDKIMEKIRRSVVKNYDERE